MKKILLTLVIWNLSFVIAQAQPSITWQKVYGWQLADYANSIVQTPDNGYILTGRANYNQLFIMRLNQFGDTVWSKLFPWEVGTKVECTIDNNYIICGLLTHVIKVDLNGNTIWTGGPYDIDCRAASIKQTPDGGFILCGGRDETPATYKPYLLKINSNGVFQWDTCYTNGIFDGVFQEIVISNDNAYVMTGNYSDTNYITDKLFIMKTDFMGNQIWFHPYDTLWYYYASSMVKDNSGNFIIAGSHYNSFLTKMDYNGVMQWFRFIYFFYPRQSICNSITNSYDNGYALTGTWDSSNIHRAYLIKTDSLGNGLWYKNYGLLDEAAGLEIKQTYDSGYIIAGTMINYNTAEDIYIIKTDKMGFANPIMINHSGSQIPMVFILHQNYPNPFNPITKIKFDIPSNVKWQMSRIKLIIYDVLGREVAVLVNELLSHGTYQVKWDGSGYTSGVYFYKLIAEEFSQTKKMILIK